MFARFFNTFSGSDGQDGPVSTIQAGEGLPDILQQGGSMQQVTTTVTSLQAVQLMGDSTNQSYMQSGVYSSSVSRPAAAGSATTMFDTGHSNLAVTGVDRNHDGIPDGLQGTGHQHGEVLATLGGTLDDIGDIYRTVEGVAPPMSPRQLPGSMGSLPPTLTESTRSLPLDGPVLTRTAGEPAIRSMTPVGHSMISTSFAEPVPMISTSLAEPAVRSLGPPGRPVSPTSTLQRRVVGAGFGPSGPALTSQLDRGYSASSMISTSTRQTDNLTPFEMRGRVATMANTMPSPLEMPSNCTLATAQAAPIATVGVDLHHTGHADTYIRGIDLNHDGIPDFMQQGAAIAIAGVDTNHDGKADTYVAGIDRNHDGIPDVMQQGGRPGAVVSTQTIGARELLVEGQTMVIEKFVADSLDPNAISLEAGQFVTVLATKGAWATVRTQFGQTGDCPLECLQYQAPAVTGVSLAPPAPPPVPAGATQEDSQSRSLGPVPEKAPPSPEPLTKHDLPAIDMSIAKVPEEPFSSSLPTSTDPLSPSTNRSTARIGFKDAATVVEIAGRLGGQGPMELTQDVEHLIMSSLLFHGLQATAHCLREEANLKDIQEDSFEQSERMRKLRLGELPPGTPREVSRLPAMVPPGMPEKCVERYRQAHENIQRRKGHANEAATQVQDQKDRLTVLQDKLTELRAAFPAPTPEEIEAGIKLRDIMTREKQLREIFNKLEATEAKYRGDIDVYTKEKETLLEDIEKRETSTTNLQKEVQSIQEQLEALQKDRANSDQAQAQRIRKLLMHWDAPQGPKRIAAETFAKVDANHDGRLEWQNDELCRFVRLIFQHHNVMVPPWPAAVWLEMYRLCDLDRSHSLDVVESLKFARSCFEAALRALVG